MGTNRLSVGLVLNHAYLRQRKAELVEGGSNDWQVDLYRQELTSSPFVKDILSEAYVVQPLMFNGDYSYLVEKKYGANFALIGDASTFIDPIFASGVFLSMNSAKLVADTVDRRLTARDGDEDGGLEEVYGHINGAYALVDKAIRMFYNPVAINFAQAGSAAGLIHKHHQNAMAVGHYLLAGDFFARHEEYSRFLDLLQDPKLSREYKDLVIDRQDFQASSCGLSWAEVFPAFSAN